MTFPFRATDPRASIYALRSLSSLDPNLKHMIRPDYSIPVEQCYAGFTKLLMSQMDSVKALSYVQDKSMRHIPVLPSWVPDFSLPGTNHLFSKCFSALGDLHKGKSIFNTFLEWNELGLESICVDAIVQTAAPRPLNGPNKKIELDENWFDLLQAIRTSDCYNNLNQSPAEVLWRTLCANMDLENNSPAPSEFHTPEMAFRDEEATRENSITLYGLLRSSLYMRAESYTGPQSRGPDESAMAELRNSMPPLTRSINGKHFD
ncbi:uncharacterized protein K444DRAFT_699647 [Hyaloscypha bicolor E]|uniref:Uncharacterized protein n=1 Tax=Hyaloscypha bicolor E TaxID=1095630 RepID=A0A2J6STD1_9HELO|nr:uncharacterized protein K444DRAFT_699647 [Hyaloscypha bicolor E]PMD53999.1 hypothetical protein K444DRAFT_699647 [Hyaloscypha bicolor E]